jgi:hypothetical protein
MRICIPPRQRARTQLGRIGGHCVAWVNIHGDQPGHRRQPRPRRDRSLNTLRLAMGAAPKRTLGLVARPRLARSSQPGS